MCVTREGIQLPDDEEENENNQENYAFMKKVHYTFPLYRTTDGGH
jgi:hypothetical protein